MKKADYEKTLQHTRRYLGSPRTAAEVAERFGISRFAAYERISALHARDQAFVHDVSRGARGKTGPKAARWISN